MTEEISKSSRNIPGVELRVSPAISVRDILNADKIVMTRAAVEKLQEVFASMKDPYTHRKAASDHREEHEHRRRWASTRSRWI